jgi:hypothetical protein
VARRVLSVRATKETALLRITQIAKDNVTWHKLEGSLAGPWVEECRATLFEANALGNPLALDLSDVIFVDEHGERLLRQFANMGIEMSNPSSFVRELLR